MPTPHTAERARELRHALTEAERALWRVLRGRQLEGYKFRRQRPVGRYIVDFVCLERALIVEVDGAHHSQQAAYDRVRDEYLRGPRFRVLRFSNREVLTEIDGVAEAILTALREGRPERPSPHPSPETGRGGQSGGPEAAADLTPIPPPLSRYGRGAGGEGHPTRPRPPLVARGRKGPSPHPSPETGRGGRIQNGGLSA